MFHHIRIFSSKVGAASTISEINKIGMFHHIRKLSSTVKAAAASSPISEVVNKGISKFPTDQISLRPFKVTDVDDLMAWGTDEKLSRYCNWVIPGKGLSYCNWIDYENLLGPFSPVVCTRPGPFCYFGWELRIYKSKEDALEDIENNILPHPWFRAICLNNRPIGKIFVDPCNRKDPYMGEIGFVVASEHWGKGIATTAVNMVLDTIFNEWPHLYRLQAQVNVENLAAHRVLEKAGFSDEWLRKSVGEVDCVDEDIFERIGEMHFLDKQGRQICIDMKVFGFLRGDERVDN